jgi:TATA-box binding protein (TBP) (component of TFIID and TFIIIB)
MQDIVKTNNPKNRLVEKNKNNKNAMTLINGLNRAKNDKYILPYDLEISTSTITCTLDIIFNVENIGLYFNDFDDILIGKRYGNRIVHNIVSYKKSLKKIKPKKIKKNKKNFFNQVSLIFCSSALMGLDVNKLSKKEQNKMVNVKLFINGSIQMTGCKHINNVKKSLEILFEKLKITKTVLNKKMEFIDKPFVDDIKKLNINNINHFKIEMINTNFNSLFQINRTKLCEILTNKNIEVSFDPINHASVSIKYVLRNTPSKEISIFVFESGSITIAGSNSYDEVLEAYQFIGKLIYENYDKLLTKIITPQIILEIIKKMK